MIGKICRLRSYREDDARSLAAIANDFEVARWLTRRFPHPYTVNDAQEWIAVAAAAPPGHILSIEVNGELAGGISIEPLDNERAGCALFGYWLGRKYWGRGVGTEAARMHSDMILRSGAARRLEATVFEPNVASAKILASAGFSLEATIPAMYLDRDDVVHDGLLYGRLA
jgi:ribosomal-protein-alanine N-acetyltransferase